MVWRYLIALFNRQCSIGYVSPAILILTRDAAARHQLSLLLAMVAPRCTTCCWANGAAPESFRNDGNRRVVQNAYSGWDLPRQTPCTPVLTSGPVVDAVWRRLLPISGGDKGLATQMHANKN
jgi:hypothetical protein